MSDFKVTDKSKYEYKNKLVIKDGAPKLLFAKIDQTGLSFNKWNLTLGCQNKEYTSEEIATAKFDKSNPLLNTPLFKNIDPEKLNEIIKKIQEDKKKMNLN